MNSVSNITNSVSNELWRLIKKDWYTVEDEDIYLQMDCLDLRKDMQPPETCISFNEVKGTNDYDKILQLMEDLFLKLSIKEDSLFAGLIDQDIYNVINKKENLIEFRRDRGENESHFGLYYLTEDEQKILTVKARLLNLLEDKLTKIIGEDEILKNKFDILKSRKKNIEREVKRLKMTVKNQIQEHCSKSGITDISIEINESGNVTLQKGDLNDTDFSEINNHIEKISPLVLGNFGDFPQDINSVLLRITSIKI